MSLVKSSHIAFRKLQRGSDKHSVGLRRASCLIKDGRCLERGNGSITVQDTQFEIHSVAFEEVKARSGFATGLSEKSSTDDCHTEV